MNKSRLGDILVILGLVILGALLLRGVAWSTPAAAYTYLQCDGPFRQTFGYPGRNPPTFAIVARQDNGNWSVTYTLGDGQTVERANQYNMVDDSNGSSDYHWSGWRVDKWMHGVLHRQGNGHLLYMEYLYDRNNTLLSSNEIDCGQAEEHAYVPAPKPAPLPVPAPAPAPTTPARPLGFLVDRCTPIPSGDDWYLAFDEKQNVAEFVSLTEAIPSTAKRYGPYANFNGMISVTAGSDQMKLYLYANGLLSWTVGGNHQGQMHCANFSYDKPMWWSDAPAASPPVAPTPPPVDPQNPVAGGDDSVPFSMVHGSIHVNVTLGNQTVDMVLDTGAEMTSITTAIANPLIASGQATEQKPAAFIMANGTTEIDRVISVHTLTIGSHTRADVWVSVSDHSLMLLGLPVLNAIGKFTIDGANSKLTFG